MNSLTFFVGFNCRACGAERAEEACGRCFEATYCSRECQASDWTAHKQFCTKETKEIGRARRAACFQQINLANLFQFFLHQRLFNLPGILKVENREGSSPGYTPFSDTFSHYEQLNLANALLGIPTYLDAKTHEVIKNIKSKDSSTIVVLFQDGNSRKKIYTIGSEDIKNLAEKVNEMPKPLLEIVIKKSLN